MFPVIPHARRSERSADNLTRSTLGEVGGLHARLTIRKGQLAAEQLIGLIGQVDKGVVEW